MPSLAEPAPLSELLHSSKASMADDTQRLYTCDAMSSSPKGWIKTVALTPAWPCPLPPPVPLQPQQRRCRPGRQLAGCRHSRPCCCRGCRAGWRRSWRPPRRPTCGSRPWPSSWPPPWPPSAWEQGGAVSSIVWHRQAARGPRHGKWLHGTQGRTPQVAAPQCLTRTPSLRAAGQGCGWRGSSKLCHMKAACGAREGAGCIGAAASARPHLRMPPPRCAPPRSWCAPTPPPHPAHTCGGVGGGGAVAGRSST